MMKIHTDVILNKHRLLVVVLLLTFSLMIGVLSACGPTQPAPYIIPILDSVSIASSREIDDESRWYANVGDTVTVSFTSKEEIRNVTATINDKTADITNTGGYEWKAARTMRADDTEGPVTFTIDLEDLAGNAYTQGATIGRTVIFDKTPPIVTCKATTDPNEEGWYFSDVTVHFDATDRLSYVPYTSDVTITTEGENQSVEKTVTDMAGNFASCEVTGINIKKLIIVAVMDGAAYEQKIFRTCEDAMDHEDLHVDSSTSYAELPSFGVNKMANAMEKINDLASTMEQQFRAKRSDVRLLLVGKSLGGAKFYRMLLNYAEELAEFHKVGVVLVDSHCVGPGDEGDCGKWNNYVYFTKLKVGGRCFNLGWLGPEQVNPLSQEIGFELPNWNDLFNSQSEQGDSDSKLRIFNIYSRRLYDGKITSILGYSFRDAYLNLHAVNWEGYSYDNVTYTNGKVYNLEEGESEPVSHWNIDNCRETSNLIREAIKYVRQ